MSELSVLNELNSDKVSQALRGLILRSRRSEDPKEAVVLESP